MREHEDHCPWPKLIADLHNHLPLITPLNTATPRTPNKSHTLTTPTHQRNRLQAAYLDHYQNLIYSPSNYPNHQTLSLALNCSLNHPLTHYLHHSQHPLHNHVHTPQYSSTRSYITIS
ncbi:hypothetical protein K469DRAFT_713870 [Zopfia rhizophila CBS 207.26]|uniref:Uncharacterized protein n=1 Tax=Zopfia rhizophila CBS 207.26 TaxID=1314779 RepID=A0A6A6DTC0_9PEZI|nr:hypothetical protein K469DRAFT_713708 [Zopfia rhizophila CBS 207.26]KAF2181438.1 hypothetical protein K469DRAFT_713870 [Zopfia rhizophila CBS 207.26]